MRTNRLAKPPLAVVMLVATTLQLVSTAMGNECASCDAPTVTLHFKLQAQLAGTVKTTLAGGEDEMVHMLSGGAVELDTGSGRFVVQSFGCGEWSASEDVTVHLGEIVTWRSDWTQDDTEPAYTEMDAGYPTPLLMNISFPEAPCLRFFVQPPGVEEFVPYEGELVTAAAPSAPGQVWRFKVEIGSPPVEGTLAASNSSNPISAGLIKSEPKEFKFHNSAELGTLCGTMPAGGASFGGGDGTGAATTQASAKIIQQSASRDRTDAKGKAGLRARHAFDRRRGAGIDEARVAGGPGRLVRESNGRFATQAGEMPAGLQVRDDAVPARNVGVGSEAAARPLEVFSTTAVAVDASAGTVESSPPPGVTAGEFLARGVGSLHMELALGTGLGSLVYETPAIDGGAYSPVRLRFDSSAEPLALYGGAQGEIRQALFATGLLDVVAVDPSRFEVRFYEPDQFHDSGSAFVIDDDNPRRRWVIENPDATPEGRVRFVGTRDGVTQVHLATWQPPGAGDSGRMTLSFFNDSVIEERTYYLDTASPSTTLSERITRRRGLTGEIEEDRLVVYGEFYHWGEEGEVFEAVVSETEDPDGAALTTFYGYYDQPTQPGGNLAWVIHPDGYWEAYNRYQTTGDLAQTIRPWIDDPADPFVATAASSLATTITYQYPQPNIEVKVEDTIWKNSVRIGYRITTTTLQPDGRIVETTETFLSATSSTVSETVKGSWQGPLLSSYEARGALRTFNRTWGYWDPAGRSFWITPGPGRVVAERTIGIEGTLAQPGGIANETTIELRYADERGRVHLEETYVNDGSPFVPGLRADWIDQRTNSYNASGQVIETTENGRIVFEAGYDADGRALWSRDATGIRMDFEYDDFGRMFRTVRSADAGTPARTTTLVLDVAGRVISQTTTAGSGAEEQSETTLFAYDLAGRLIQTTAPDGLIRAESETMLAGGNGAPQRRRIVTTNPDGSQEIVELYRDRRLFRRYGSAEPAEFWGYGVNSYGEVAAAFRDLGGTQLRVQRITDWVGNTLFDVLPGFTGQGFHVTSNTFGGSGPLGTGRGLLVARSVPGRATERFEHDELGRTVASGLDLDASGALERAGLDPITLSRVVLENPGTGWSRVEQMRRLETDGSVAETIVNERREKLGALPGGLVASVESREPGGARTLTEVSIDRSAASRTTLVRDFAASGSAPPAITVEIAGLVRTTRTPEASVETVYDYDALGRLKSVVSPLSGAITHSYDSGGRLEATTDSLLRETRLTYHPQGQPGAGRVATSRDPVGNMTHFEYDTRGRLWRQWGANVYPQEFGYNDDDQLTSLRTFRTLDAPAVGGVDWTSPSWPANAPTGDLTQWIHDPSGLLDRKRYADGSEVVYAYDSARRLQARTNARGQTITHNYTALGLQDSVTYPAGSLTTNCSYLYDRAGRLRNLTDGSGTRTLEYDPETGGVTGEAFTSGPLAGQSVVRGFDAFGRQESLEVPTVFALGWEFDSLNRPERITGASGTVSGLEVTYVRESGGDRLENIEWRHGAALRLQSARSYDSISRLTGVATLDGSGAVLQNHGYSLFDELDRRKRVDREDGKTWKYSYDTRGQLTGAEFEEAGGQAIPGHEFGFAFDTIGNRTMETQSTLASAYQANALNQYEERTVPGAIRVVGSAETDTFVTADFRAAARQGEWFSVDIPVDNESEPVWKEFDVVAVRSGAGPGGEDDVASVARSAFVAKTPEEFVHDLDGNLTSDGRWSYTWDAENRLVAMETQSGVVEPDGPVPESQRTRLEFTYDCQSRRIAKKVFSWTGADWALASHALYLYDGWNVIAEFDAISGSSLARTYVWGLDLSGSGQGAGGVGGLLAVVDANGTHAPWWDGNGNATGYSNLATGAEEARFTYGPFGETLSATGPLADTFTHRFSTKFTDPESGLLYYGFRYYSPSTGRWLSREPLGERESSNTYRATSNNLVNRFDVLGLYEEAGHFYTTYSVGVAAGLSREDAFRLAYYAQLPDEFAPLDAKTAYLAAHGDPWLERKILGARSGSGVIRDYITGLDREVNAWGRDVQELLHSLHGLSGEDLLTRRDCIGTLIRDGSLQPWEKGFLLHAFGDTFSHVFERDGVLTAHHYPDGHKDDSLADRMPGGRSLTDPDIIGNFPDRYGEYVNALFDLFGGPESRRVYLNILLSSSLTTTQGHGNANLANRLGRAVATGGFEYDKGPFPEYAPETGEHVIDDSMHPTPTASDVNALFELIKEHCCQSP